MPNWLRALIAGYGAKKLGGGCLSTIIIFIVIYYALGQCNHPVHHGAVMPVKPATTQTATAIRATTAPQKAGIVSCAPTIIPAAPSN